MRSVKQLLSYSLAALDGEIGRVRGFHFDDQDWVVRYVLVDGGDTAPERRLFIASWALGKVYADLKVLEVALAREKVTDKPLPESDSAPFCQAELQNPDVGEGQSFAGAPISREQEANRGRPDSRLRSVQDVIGFALQGLDATIGHIEDFLVDESDWTVCFLVVDMGYPSFGKHVLIPPHVITDARWSDAILSVRLSRKEAESYSSQWHGSPTPYGRASTLVHF